MIYATMIAFLGKFYSVINSILFPLQSDTQAWDPALPKLRR